MATGEGKNQTRRAKEGRMKKRGGITRRQIGRTKGKQRKGQWGKNKGWGGQQGDGAGKGGGRKQRKRVLVGGLQKLLGCLGKKKRQGKKQTRGVGEEGSK